MQKGFEQKKEGGREARKNLDSGCCCAVWGCWKDFLCDPSLLLLHVEIFLSLACVFGDDLERFLSAK